MDIDIDIDINRWKIPLHPQRLPWVNISFAYFFTTLGTKLVAGWLIHGQMATTPHAARGNLKVTMLSGVGRVSWFTLRNPKPQQQLLSCVHHGIMVWWCDEYIYIHTYITLHYITLHYITLHYITLHYITLHYITLHYITLHYITLHYITYTHTHVHIPISLISNTRHKGLQNASLRWYDTETVSFMNGKWQTGCKI